MVTVSSDSQAAPQSAKVSQEHPGNDDDSNIVFKSNNEVQFSIQKKYLKIATGGLPPSSSSSLDSEAVSLPESSETLKILFGFIYPRRHPSLLDMKFGVLQSVAEAAEMYEVYAAMNHCQMCMAQRVAEYGPEVAVYAAKHGYPSLLDSAAPHALKIPLGEMADLLPPHLLASWIKYYQKWLNVQHRAILRGLSHHHTSRAPPAICAHWEHVYRSRILTKLTNDLSVLLDLEGLFAVSGESSAHGDGCCLAELGWWKEAVVEEVRGVGSFSEVVGVCDAGMGIEDSGDSNQTGNRDHSL